MPADTVALTEHLLHHIALSGTHGVNKHEFERLVTEFYDRYNSANEVDQQSHSELGLLFSEQPPKQAVVVDHGLLETVLTLLIENPEIHIQSQLHQDDDKQASTTSLSRVDGKCIFTTRDRMWQAVTGHGYDTSRVSGKEFDILSVIAAHGPAGVTQPLVTKLTGQDKRSVPKRTDRLRDAGYITKVAIVGAGLSTSLLKLKRFATDGDSSVPLPAGLGDGPSGSSYIDSNAWFRQLVHILQSNNMIASSADVRLGLGITPGSWESKVFKRCMSRLVDAGCLRRISARMLDRDGQPIKTKNGVERMTASIQLLRDPTEADRLTWVKSQPPGTQNTTQDAAESRTKDENDADEPANVFNAGVVDPSLISETERCSNEQQGATMVRTAEATDVTSHLNAYSLWDPYIPFVNHLFRIIDSAGPRGLSGQEIASQLIGPYWRKNLDDSLVKLIDPRVKSQPPNLDHLRIVRDTVVVGKAAVALLRTLPNFEAAIALGQALRVDETSQANLEDPEEPTLDSWGFVTPRSIDLLSDDGAATLAESNAGRVFEVPPSSRVQIPSTAHLNGKIRSGGRGRPRKSNAPTKSQQIPPPTSIQPPAAKKPKPYLLKIQQRERRREDIEREEYEEFAQMTAERQVMLEVMSQSDVSSGQIERSDLPEARVAQVKADILSRKRTGVYINPPGARALKIKHEVARGRPRLALIAVFKLNQLATLPWFIQDVDSPEPPEQYHQSVMEADASTAPDLESPRKRKAEQQPEVIIHKRQRYDLMQEGRRGTSVDPMSLVSEQGSDIGADEVQAKPASPDLVPEEVNPHWSSSDIAERLEQLKKKRGRRSKATLTEMRLLEGRMDEINVAKYLESAPSRLETTPAPQHHPSLQPSVDRKYVEDHPNETFYHRGGGKWHFGLPPYDSPKAIINSIRGPGAALFHIERQKLDLDGVVSGDGPSATEQVPGQDEGSAGHEIAETQTDVVQAGQTLASSKSGNDEDGSYLRPHDSRPAEERPCSDREQMTDRPADSTAGSEVLRVAVAAPNDEDSSMITPNRAAESHVLPSNIQKQPQVHGRSHGTNGTGAQCIDRQTHSLPRVSASDPDIKMVDSQVHGHQVDLTREATFSNPLDHPPPQLPRVTMHSALKRNFKRKSGGTLHAIRQQLILDTVRQCAGVFPGNNEMWYVYETVWANMSSQTPDRQTIARVIDSLVEEGKIVRYPFHFQSKKGVTQQRIVIAEPSVSSDSPILREMQERIAQAFPQQYLPPEVDITPELRRQAQTIVVKKRRPLDVAYVDTPDGEGDADTLSTSNNVVAVQQSAQRLALLDKEAQDLGFKDWSDRRDYLSTIKKRRKSTREVVHLEDQSGDEENSDDETEVPAQQAAMQSTIQLPNYVFDPSDAAERRTPGSRKRFAERLSLNKHTTIRALRNPAESTATNATHRRRLYPGRKAGPGSRLDSLIRAPPYGETQLKRANRAYIRRANTILGLRTAPYLPSVLAHSQLANPTLKHSSDIASRYASFQQQIRAKAAQEHNLNRKPPRKSYARGNAAASLQRDSDDPATNDTSRMSQTAPLTTGLSEPLELDSIEAADLDRRHKDSEVLNLKEFYEKRSRVFRGRDRGATTTFKDVEKLIVAIALIKVISPLAAIPRMDWTMTAAAIGNQYEGDWLRRRWLTFRASRKVDVDKWERAIQRKFLPAYERGTLPSNLIDLDDLSSADMPGLLRWVESNVSPEDERKDLEVDFHLPSSLAQLESWFKIEDAENVLELDGDEFFTVITEKDRRQTLIEKYYGIPLEAGTSELDILALAKSWARAVAMTRAEVYDAEQAAAKLRALPAETIDTAVHQLVDSQYLLQEKKGRQLPGRNYLIHPDVLSLFQRWPGRQEGYRYLMTVANVRTGICSHLEANDKFRLEQGSAVDAEYLVMTNMIAQGLVEVHVELPSIKMGFDEEEPRLSPWGIPGASYETKKLNGNTIKSPLVYTKSAQWTTKHGLVPGVNVPRRPAKALDGGYPTPMWVDIHGSLIPEVWEMVLSSLLHLLVQRPGITAVEIERAHSHRLWSWEVELALRWMLASQMARITSTGDDVSSGRGELRREGWTVSEWWYCAMLPEMTAWRFEHDAGE